MSKGLEALEKITNYKCNSMSEKIECKEIIEKELKVLEIIKEKVKIEFNDHYFGFANNYYIIVNNGALNPIKATKEEFDLLMEVLK